MIRTIAITAAALAAIGGTAVTIDTGAVTAMHRSCGYHCNPNGDGTYTPAAPPTIIQVQPAGRANVHSGGRTGGFANKRVGCGGCKGHPASNDVIEGGLWGIQPMMTDGFGRTRGTRPHHPRASCRCN